MSTPEPGDQFLVVEAAKPERWGQKLFSQKMVRGEKGASRLRLRTGDHLTFIGLATEKKSPAYRFAVDQKIARPVEVRMSPEDASRCLRRISG